MREIPLTRDKVALVDDEDYERIAAYRWWSLRGYRDIWYAVRQERRDGKVFQIAMHREILQGCTAKRIDHKDHDGLNNQKSNLRPCTPGENAIHFSHRRANNRSGFRGVGWHKQRGRWRARLDEINLGLFDDPAEAARAYDAAAIKEYGEFACLNFPKLPDNFGVLEGLI